MSVCPGERFDDHHDGGRVQAASASGAACARCGADLVTDSRDRNIRIGDDRRRDLVDGIAAGRKRVSGQRRNAVLVLSVNFVPAVTSAVCVFGMPAGVAHLLILKLRVANRSGCNTCTPKSAVPVFTPSKIFNGEERQVVAWLHPVPAT